MPLVLKKKLKLLQQNIDGNVLTPKYTGFMKEWYTNCNQTNVFSFLSSWYEGLFGCFPPKQPLEMIKLKIEYELLVRDFEVAKVALPPRLKANWEASRDFKLDKLQGVTRGYTEFQVKQQGVGEMVKAKAKEAKVSAKKEKKMSVTGYYEHLFAGNHTHKLSDFQLAKEMCEQFPNKKKYTAEDIKAVRGMYNRGKLSTQKGGVRPETQSVSYTNTSKEPVVSRTAVVKKMLGKPQPIVKKKVVVLKKK